MKILLTKPYLPKAQRTIVTLPSGLLYLGSYLKQRDFDGEVKILDPDLFTGSLEAFVNEIAAYQPDVVGITLFSHVLELANELVGRLKRALPHTLVLIGGYHVNAVGGQGLVQIPLADYLMRGEAEKGLYAFCQQLAQHGRITAPEAVPGLIYRAGGSVVENPAAFTPDLAEFDPLDFSLIDVEAYFAQGSPMGVFRRGSRVAQIITTRGCPFACTFCAAALNMGKKVRRRPVENILAEIKTLIALGADEMHIMDDNFTMHREHVIELCRALVEGGFKINFSMPNGVRLDLLDEEMLRWMKRAGWYHLGFGVEVGSDAALKLIKKNLSMAKIEEKIRLIRKVGGITITGFFILGLPHDTLATMRATAATPDRLGLDMASFGNFTPLPGTESYRALVQGGEISADYLPSFANGIVTYAPPGISHTQLAKIQRDTVLRYWLHPKRMALVVRRLRPQDLVYALRRMYNIVFRPKNELA